MDNPRDINDISIGFSIAINRDMIGYSFEFVGLSGNRSKLINLAFCVVCRCGLAIGVEPSGYTDIDLE